MEACAYGGPVRYILVIGHYATEACVRGGQLRASTAGIGYLEPLPSLSFSRFSSLVNAWYISSSLSLACQYLMMPLWSPEMSVFPEWLHAIDRTALVCAFIVTTMTSRSRSRTKTITQQTTKKSTIQGKHQTANNRGWHSIANST